jgi:hypothetical protein
MLVIQTVKEELPFCFVHPINLHMCNITPNVAILVMKLSPLQLKSKSDAHSLNVGLFHTPEPVELMKEHVFLRACTPNGFPFTRSETSRKCFEEFVRRILGAGIMCHHIHTHQTHGLRDDDNIITMVAHIEVEI